MGIDQNINVKIIIVDDSTDDHFFIKESLRDFKNISFQSFYDGEHFINYMKNQKTDSNAQYPDMVILDLNMPKLTGLEVFEQIKKDGLLGNIKFLILTTTLSCKDLEKAENLNLDYYTKPFSINEFSNLLQKIIEGFL